MVGINEELKNGLKADNGGIEGVGSIGKMMVTMFLGFIGRLKSDVLVPILEHVRLPVLSLADKYRNESHVARYARYLKLNFISSFRRHLPDRTNINLYCSYE